MGWFRRNQRTIIVVTLVLFGLLLLAGYRMGPDKTLQPPADVQSNSGQR